MANQVSHLVFVDLQLVIGLSPLFLFKFLYSSSLFLARNK